MRLQILNMNFRCRRPTGVLNNEVDTIFFTTSLEYAYLSSSTVKEAAYFGADISKFVPPNVVIEVKNKLMKNKGDR